MNPSTYLKESRSWDIIAIENKREKKLRISFKFSSLEFLSRK